MMLVAAWPAIAVAQSDDGASDSGGADPGSPQTWDSFWVWLLIAIGAFALLALLALGVRARRARAPDEQPPPDDLAPPFVDPVRTDGTRAVAVAAFDHVAGADRAYAAAEASDRGARWLRETTFVEFHRHGRTVVRGTFAGHYLDVDDAGAAMDHDLAVGPMAAAILGLVAEAADRDTLEARDVAQLKGARLDAIRAELPDPSSALLVFAPADDVDAMVQALGAVAPRIVRRRVAPDAARALQDVAADAPRAAL
jgi:hypothetical protein